MLLQRNLTNMYRPVFRARIPTYQLAILLLSKTASIQSGRDSAVRTARQARTRAVASVARTTLQSSCAQ